MIEGLAVVLLVLALGAGLLRLLGVPRTLGAPSLAGWAWVSGSLVAGLLTLAWATLGLIGRAPWLQFAAFAAIAGLLWRLGRGTRPLAMPPAPSHARGERALLALALLGTLAFCAALAVGASARPMVLGDEAHFYALKAKLLFDAGGLGADYVDAAERLSHHSNLDYPPLNPLLQLLVFERHGAVTHAANRLPLVLFTPALLLMLAGAAARVARPHLAALLVLAIGTSAVVASQSKLAMSDLAVAAAALGAAEATLLARHDLRWTRCAAACLATALLFKHDARLLLAAGITAALMELVLARSARRRGARALGWVAVPAAALLLVQTLNAATRASNVFDGSLDGRSLVGRMLAQAPARLPGVLEALLRDILLDPAFAGFVPLAALALLLRPRVAFGPATRALGVALFLAAAGLAAVFCGLPHDQDWHWATAGTRAYFQLAPATALWVAAVGAAAHPRILGGRSA